ncbi:leucine-rich repeat protein 1 [Spea bombifrons]|uniref:leucine-rich repeat protein 1 n=1 Tax=Spea bombifrons TaxID=233779 RepID=UPI002349FD8D|nr:leucine-rich repeat protein 1 [Spea bombifrons]
MKLQCEVEVISRMLPTFGMRNRGKGARAVLSVGRQEDKRSGQAGAVYLMICTLKDKAGSRYKLQENIDQLFTRFVQEGKATVRLKEPAVDICLSKADVCSLKNFISTVGLANKGKDPGSISLSRLTPVKTSEIEKPRAKMFITCKKDYPITKSFPYSLEHLQVSYCKLARVDMRMLCLKKLQKLDLSNNHIKKLPQTIGDLMCLQELTLHNNFLESFEVAFCNSTLRNTLKSLDLSQNKLKALPVQFGQLKELINLKLDDNELVQLPFTIGLLSKLRFLSATKNKIQCLPSSFRSLVLEKVDLFGNPFVKATPMVPDIQLKIPLPLLECASRATIHYRIPYGPHLIPATVCQDLSVAKTCDCGRPCLSSFIQTVVLMNLHQVSQTVVLVDTMGGTEAPVICYFCSLTCYSEFLDKHLQSARI